MGARVRQDPAMKPNRLAELRLRAGLTQSELAEKLGTDKMQISRLERGERRLTFQWQERLAAFFKCSTDDLLAPSTPSKNDTPSASSTAQPIPGAFRVAMGQRDLPIRGLAMGGDGHLHLSSDVVDWTWRPPELMGVANAFAVFCTGDSMEDAVMEGTILLVHPHAPVRPRDLCVIELADGVLMVKRLLRRTASDYHLRQYNPAQDFTVPTASVRNCWRVCGTQMP